MKSVVLFILIAVAAISSAGAETINGTPNEIFRPISKVHVQKVLDAGITKIKKLDLKKLLKELDTVEWRTFNYGFLSGSGGKRFTSIYVVEDKMVVINMMSLQNMVGKPIPMYGWSLHEAMGALGYSDENYELSSSISYIAITSANEVNAIESNFKKIARTSKNFNYSGDGGSTIIGGGGDASMIEFKQKLMLRLKKWIELKGVDVESRAIEKALTRITQLKLELDLQGQRYVNLDFRVEGDKVIFDYGVDLRPEEIYKDEYVDNVLDALQDYLFN